MKCDFCKNELGEETVIWPLKRNMVYCCGKDACLSQLKSVEEIKKDRIKTVEFDKLDEWKV